ncbi:MAG: 16S rRNA (cytidine(1402)-2'-O)-methyltransferase [Epsilonproteobacteria bacterium]|nr:16S rRNA (cytidine(1402)-2'-O)-methyltransferase [Campylobacterota bacterium]
MVIFIPTPIGNILDITYRAIETLKEIEIIFCEDTRVTKNLLKLLQERLDITFPNYQLISFNEYNATKRIKEFKSQIEVAKVAFMSDAGMPAISDPGSELVRFCQENKIEYDFLPGASVAPLVYAASGFESGKFYFYGFLPSKGKSREEELKRALKKGIDTIFYEAPHRIINLLELLKEYDINLKVFVAKELTKKHQRYFFGEIKEVLEEIRASSTKGEWAVVVEGKEQESFSLELDEILALDIPPKIKAKLVAKTTNRPIKECYIELTQKK